MFCKKLNESERDSVRSQWGTPQKIALSQLGTSSMMIRKIQDLSVVMFGLLVVLTAVADRRSVWVLFDYVTAIYFLLVVVASWSFPVKDPRFA